MFWELYVFFYNVISNGVTTNSALDRFLTQTSFNVGGVAFNGVAYICTLLALISLIFIIVLCCLFIWKLIKLVGRLFSGGAL